MSIHTRDPEAIGAFEEACKHLEECAGEMDGQDIEFPDEWVQKFNQRLKCWFEGFCRLAHALELLSPKSRNRYAVFYCQHKWPHDELAKWFPHHGAFRHSPWVKKSIPLCLSNVEALTESACGLTNAVVRAVQGLPTKEERESYEETRRRVKRQAGRNAPLIVGESNEILKVWRLILRAAGTDKPVLIYGETGTGKELVARMIHFASERKTKTLVVRNCGGFSYDDKLQSELFGHVKGAFSGATSCRTGAFAVADRGTLFLDEIGDLSKEGQTKLLRVIEYGEVLPLGADEHGKVDVRIIAATNRKLELEVKNGAFREDLLERLKVLCIDLPPLRERAEDIEGLIWHFAREKASSAAPRREYIAELQQRRWPRNVRQLRNEVLRALVERDESTFAWDEAARQLLQQRVAWALEKAEGNQTRAAELLCMPRTTLRDWMEGFGMAPGQ